MTKKFRVIVRHLPERDVFYPNCENSDLFFALMKSITPKRTSFTVDNLRIIRKMGYEVVQDGDVPNPSFQPKRLRGI